MITVKNLTTGEMIQVRDVKLENGKIIATWQRPEPGQRFMAANVAVVKTEETVHDDEHNVERRVLALANGWQVIKGRTPKPVQSVVATEETIVAENAAEILEPLTNTEAPAIEEANVVEETTVVEAPVEKPKKKRTPKQAANTAGEVASIDGMKAEMLAKYGTMGADIFEAVCKVAKIQPSSVDAKDVQRICADMIKDIKPQTADYGTITINNETHNVTGKVTAKFKAICTTIAKGYPLYMYGDAGTGKSHTAKQVAEALGLDFYESQQVLFAHEMKGYGDAGGNFVPTPFFKAFTMGGLFFLDEIDASQPEALVVLNTAIANRRFDFPVVGNVEAHPNFRVIAAGNTKMTGADIEYTARSVQDASTKNRFFFTNVDYTKEIEDMLAGDDISIANFCRDLRHAKTAAQITLCVSYRSIQTLADKDMQEAWGLKDLIMGGIFKELEPDEIRILYNNLENKSNKWAKAMASLFEEA